VLGEASASGRSGSSYTGTVDICCDRRLLVKSVISCKVLSGVIKVSMLCGLRGLL